MELSCTLVQDLIFPRLENRFSGKCHLPYAALHQLQLSLGDCVEITAHGQVYIIWVTRFFLAENEY